MTLILTHAERIETVSLKAALKKSAALTKKVKKRFYGRERLGLPAFDLVELLPDPALKRLL